MSSINSLTNQQIATSRDLRPAPTSSERRSVAAAAREDEFTPAPNFVRLMDIIRQIPQIRQEVIGEVAQRLAGGDLLTPEARDETVKAILSSEMPGG